MKLRHLLALAAALSIGLASVTLADPVLAGHSGFAGQSLDADGVKSVLLGKKTTVGNIRTVIIIAKDSPAQEQFIKEHLAMTSSQFQNHWRRLFMTGGGSAPKVVENAADLAKLLATVPGAIGITDHAAAGELTILAK